LADLNAAHRRRRTCIYFGVLKQRIVVTFFEVYYLRRPVFEDNEWGISMQIWKSSLAYGMMGVEKGTGENGLVS